jgi:hypothetical protein
MQAGPDATHVHDMLFCKIITTTAPDACHTVYRLLFMRLKGLVEWLSNMPTETAATGGLLIQTYELALAAATLSCTLGDHRVHDD